VGYEERMVVRLGSLGMSNQRVTGGGYVTQHCQRAFSWPARLGKVWGLPSPDRHDFPASPGTTTLGNDLPLHRSVLLDGMGWV
jgi:hypothetical protein